MSIIVIHKKEKFRRTPQYDVWEQYHQIPFCNSLRKINSDSPNNNPRRNHAT